MERGVFCWVCASDGGQGISGREGFGEVWRLEVELGEFGEGMERERDWKDGNGDRRWGRYT